MTVYLCVSKLRDRSNGRWTHHFFCHSTNQAALDAHTTVDAQGVRRPLDRALAFFSPGTTPSAPTVPTTTPAETPAAAASSSEGAMDPALLRRALAARRKQVARLTEFRSRRTREIEARRLKTKVCWGGKDCWFWWCMTDGWVGGWVAWLAFSHPFICGIGSAPPSTN